MSRLQNDDETKFANALKHNDLFAEVFLPGHASGLCSYNNFLEMSKINETESYFTTVNSTTSEAESNIQ